MVASGDLGGHVRLWDVRTRDQIGDTIETPNTSPREVSFVAFHPDGESVAFAAGDFTDQEINLVDVESRDDVASKGGLWPLDSGAVLPDGSVRAASIKYPHITLVTANPSAMRRIRVGSASASALSPDGATLLVGDEHGRISVWDADGLKPLGSPFAGDPSSVAELAFSGDGETFVAAGENGSVRVWQHVFWSNVRETRSARATTPGAAYPQTTGSWWRPEFPIARRADERGSVRCGLTNSPGANRSDSPASRVAEIKRKLRFLQERRRPLTPSSVEFVGPRPYKPDNRAQLRGPCVRVKETAQPRMRLYTAETSRPAGRHSATIVSRGRPRLSSAEQLD